MTAEQEAACLEFLPLAKSEAWKSFQRAPHALELDELHAIALGAVVQAIERWPRYCWDKHATTPADPQAARYLSGYVIKRMRGALLDHQRGLDHVTRAQRHLIKQLQAAEQALGPGSTLAEQVRHAGVDPEQARRALADAELRPGYLDEYDGEGRGAAEAIADDQADTEGRAFVGTVLDQVADTVEGMDEVSQWVILLRYYEGLSLPKVAEGLGITQDECRERWETAVCELHDTMLRAAQPGCQCGSSGACSCAA